MSNSGSPEYGLQPDGTFLAPAGRIHLGWDLISRKHGNDTVYLHFPQAEVTAFLKAVQPELSDLPEHTNTASGIAAFLSRKQGTKINLTTEELTVALKPVLAERSLFEENLLLFRNPGVVVTVVLELLHQAQVPQRRKAPRLRGVL